MADYGLADDALRGDYEAARLFADPSVSPEEKRRRLQELMGPPPDMGPDLRLALNDGAGGSSSGPESLPDVPPPPIAAGAGGTTGASAPSPMMGSEGAGATEQRAPAPPLTEPAGVPVSLDEDDAGPGMARGVTPGDYRSAASRAALLLGGGGGPQRPMEQVREEQQITEGTLSPDARDAYLAAQGAADEATVNADYWQQKQQQGELEIKARAAEEAVSERARFEQIQAQHLAEAKKVNDRRIAVSEEIANTPPGEEGLFVGMNTGEKMLSFLGIAMMGLGLGATGNAGQILPTLKAMALREVDKQKRLVEVKQGQADALGTVYERHFANLKDEELASQAALSDIMTRAEMQTLQMLRDSGANLSDAQLQAKLAQLEADRIERTAKLDAMYGDKVQRNLALAYTRERQMAPRAQAAAAGPAGPPDPAQFRSPEEYFAAKQAFDKGAAPLDESVRVATGQPAPARPRAQVSPKAGPTVTAKDEAGPAAASDRGNGQRIAALHSSGRTDEAVSLMTPSQRRYLGALFKQSKKDLGESATDADAMDHAFQKLGLEGGAKLIPQSARGRVVTLGDGTQLFAPTETIAKEVQPKLSALDNLLGSMRRLKRLAESPARNTNPSLRSEIANLATTIKFQLSKAQEQGVVREAEAPLYDMMSGGALGQIILDPTRDVKRELDTTVSVFAAERKRLTQNLSRNHEMDQPYRRVE